MFRHLSLALVTGLMIAGTATSPASAVIVDYTLTFTGNHGNGTGTLVLDEPLPLATFQENFAGDLVSLQATIGGITYNFNPAAVDVNLGTGQMFYSISGASVPVVNPSPPGLTEILMIGGGASNGNFNIVNNGGPNLDDGTWTISAGVIASVPEPSTWALLLLGFAAIGAMTYRRSKSAMVAA